jgi:CheY-like chemotaxis protein
MAELPTILLADDSITVRKLVELAFENEPFLVTTVDDGGLALKAALRDKPDIVLADVHMPALNGYQLCKAVKTSFPDTPVLLLVGTFEILNADEVQRCGADGVLAKPFADEELIQVVKELIRMKPVKRRKFSGEPVSTNVTTRIKVFLCHAFEDKPAVRRLYQRFKAEGFHPWLDEENLLPGEDWRLAITTHLRNCDAVVVCLSPRSVTKAGYVQKEIAFALERLAEHPEGSVFLIPLLLEDCEIPQRLAHLHAARLPLDQGFARVCESLRSRISSKNAR